MLSTIVRHAMCHGYDCETGVGTVMRVVKHCIGKIVRYGMDTIVRLVWAGHTFMRVVKHGIGPTVRHAMGAIVRLARAHL